MATLTFDATMVALEAAGSEQTRKTYRRHGARDPMFGVSYADLGKLQKRIKVDQALAEQLWDSGNHDARILATFVADPLAISPALVDAWMVQANNDPLSSALAANLVSRTPFALDKHRAWIESPEEWSASAGWQLLAHLALRDETLPQAFYESALARIERDLQSALNQVRHAMNGALIAIGGRNEALAAQAMAAAGRIGKVVVDHGDTACKTPDAIPYIRKMRERAAKRKA